MLKLIKKIKRNLKQKLFKNEKIETTYHCKMDDELKYFCREAYFKKFKTFNPVAFEEDWNKYINLKPFKINENIFDVLKDEPNAYNFYDERVHFIIRNATQFRLTQAFEAMKIDMTDPNVRVVPEEGNIGTPGRIAKMYVGANLHDDSELLCGRWTYKPRIASFPEDEEGYTFVEKGIPITKMLDLTAVCSHHLAPFSTDFKSEAYAIISYIPDEDMLGISKLPRLAQWIGSRGWLQEDLTKAIYNEVKEVAKTSNVYVKLYKIVHTCESIRGAKSKKGSFTTEAYGGAFKRKKLRDQVIQGL